MTAAQDVPIPYRIIALMQEQNRLFAYPLKRMAIEIWSTKFRCKGCGACCTRAINRHIFLLDRDVDAVKKIDPTAYEPAPDPEFCDQNGMLYVSGYALRMRDDEAGSCWFLENNKCRIYDHRFSGCRIYPHMLRRGSDTSGKVQWHQFARRDEHGYHDTAPPLEECLTLAREIKEYETAFLNQQIAFLETIHEYFAVHNLRHDPAEYTNQMQQYQQGRPVKIKVFHAGELEECRIARSPV
ncbi:MAG: YkgJ family cysteine cluster protein [Methanoregula sp.]